jgi:hypothetical protein
VTASHPGHPARTPSVPVVAPVPPVGATGPIAYSATSMRILMWFPPVGAPARSAGDSGLRSGGRGS